MDPLLETASRTPYKPSDAKERSVLGRVALWGMGLGVSTYALLRGVEALSRSQSPDTAGMALGGAIIAGTIGGIFTGFQTKSHNRTAHLISSYESLEQAGQLTPERVHISPYFEKPVSTLGSAAQGALLGGALGSGLEAVAQGVRGQWATRTDMAIGAVPGALFGTALGVMRAREQHAVRDIHHHFAARAELNAAGFAAREQARPTASGERVHG